MAKPVARTVNELGHALKMIAGKGDPIDIYGCLFWGNQNGVSGITDVLDFPFVEAVDGWVNEEHGVGINRKGDFIAKSVPKDPAVKFSIYISPNAEDVSLYISAFLTALSYALPPKQE
jgi:hypothetical protein